MDHPCGRSRSPPYLVLLRAGFCLPPLLPEARCALTAPFHPYPPSPSALRPRAMAWRYIFCATGPSGCPARELPGALSCWSSDFPLPALVPFARPSLAEKVGSGPVAGSDRLAHYGNDQCIRRDGARRESGVGSRESGVGEIENCPASRVKRVVQTIQHCADASVGLHDNGASLTIEEMVAERHFQLRLELAL
jgi:hypothetical protein